MPEPLPLGAAPQGVSMAGQKPLGLIDQAVFFCSGLPPALPEVRPSIAAPAALIHLILDLPSGERNKTSVILLRSLLSAAQKNRGSLSGCHSIHSGSDSIKEQYI